jgi:Protein of unknown function (DUF3987)
MPRKFDPLDEALRRSNHKKPVHNGAQAVNSDFGTFGTIGTPVKAPAGRPWDAPDLSLLGTGRTLPPKFPTEFLGPFWQKWCEDNAHAKCCPVDYVVGSLLSVAASLIGNARRPSPHTKWKEPAHLWIGLVGSPSSGKTPGMSPVLEIISKFNRASVEETKRRQIEYKKTCEKADLNRAVWRDAARKK